MCVNKAQPVKGIVKYLLKDRNTGCDSVGVFRTWPSLCIGAIKCEADGMRVSSSIPRP